MNKKRVVNRQKSGMDWEVRFASKLASLQG